MIRTMKKLVPLVAFALALVVPSLLPRFAHAMYDPKHGRWYREG
jgi:hypothetical protein